MRKVGLRRILALLGLAAAGYGQHKEAAHHSDPNGHSYYPAFLSSNGSIPPRTDLVVCPFVGKAFRISTSPVRGLALSLEGKALYGGCLPFPDEPNKTAVCRFDLITTSTAIVAGSIGLNAADIAVSNREESVLVGGLYREGKDVRGLFELAPPSGTIRQVFLTDMSPLSSWVHLSLAPDGKRAVGIHNRRLELIDIVRGTAEPLGDGFFLATWSPDGKWLAALENGEHGHTILMEATTMTRKRILGHTELAWSPDSRYLLGMKQKDRCGPYYGTLEAIDVETGARTTITSSECQVNRATAGWVSKDIAER